MLSYDPSLPTLFRVFIMRGMSEIVFLMSLVHSGSVQRHRSLQKCHMIFHQVCSGLAQSTWDQSGSIVPGWMGKNAMGEKEETKILFHFSIN